MSTAVNKETIKRKKWGRRGGHIIEVGKMIMKIGKDYLCKMELNKELIVTWMK